ncbi:MAG: hypothetical protein EXR75_14725 [Myxococcales bacterium]|nr:hypothetical protein [Myxococcales bacterium]
MGLRRHRHDFGAGGHRRAHLPGPPRRVRDALGRCQSHLFGSARPHHVVGTARRWHPRGTLHEYRIRVVSRLWLLKRRRGSRVFQQLGIDTIVDATLRGLGMTTEWRLLRALPLRDYCTQYEETDYDFVCRLLAEAGVYFYFAHRSATDDLLSAILDGTGAAHADFEALFAGDHAIFGSDALFYSAIADAGPPGTTVAAATSALMSPALRVLVRTGMALSQEDTVSQFVPSAQVRSRVTCLMRTTASWSNSG